jgi:hypothetical protein
MAHSPLKVRTHYPLIENLDLSAIIACKQAPNFDNPCGFLSSALKSTQALSGRATIPFSQVQFDEWLLRTAPVSFVERIEGVNHILWIFHDLTCILMLSSDDDDYAIIPWPLKLSKFLHLGGRHYRIEDRSAEPGVYYDYKSGSLTLTSYANLLGEDEPDHGLDVIKEVRSDYRAALITDITKLAAAFADACPLGADAHSIDAARTGTVAFPWFLQIDIGKDPDHYGDIVTDIILASGEFGPDQDVYVDIDGRYVLPTGEIEPAKVLLTTIGDDDYFSPSQSLSDLFAYLFDMPDAPIKLVDQLSQRRGLVGGHFGTVDVPVRSASAHARIEAADRIQKLLEQRA